MSVDRCNLQLSGMATCPQPVLSRGRRCYYHGKLEAGLIALDRSTISAITRGVEGDLARSIVYAPALRRARNEVSEAREYQRLRDGRRDLETLLLLDAAGELEAWKTPDHPKEWNTPKPRSDQRKRGDRERVRVWRAV